MWLPLICPLLGTWSTTQACALTGNRTGDPLVRRLALSPLSHTSQDSHPYFKCQWPIMSSSWPGTSYVTSYPAPPLMCYFCQFPSIFYLLSAAVFSQSKSFQWHRASGFCLSHSGHISSPGYVTGPWMLWKSHTPFVQTAVQLSTRHGYAKYVKSCPVHFPLLPT